MASNADVIAALTLQTQQLAQATLELVARVPVVPTGPGTGPAAVTALQIDDPGDALLRHFDGRAGVFRTRAEHAALTKDLLQRYGPAVGMSALQIFRTRAEHAALTKDLL